MLSFILFWGFEIPCTHFMQKPSNNPLEPLSTEKIRTLHITQNIIIYSCIYLYFSPETPLNFEWPQSVDQVCGSRTCNQTHLYPGRQGKDPVRTRTHCYVLTSYVYKHAESGLDFLPEIQFKDRQGIISISDADYLNH